VLDGVAEVAARELLDVEPELGRDRLVEAVAADEVVADRVRRPLAEDGPARVTRDQPGEGEHDEDDPDQDRDRDDEPADDEAGHVRFRAPMKVRTGSLMRERGRRASDAPVHGVPGSD